jgi:hypothetical protein
MKFRRALKLLNVAAVAAIVLPLAYFGTFAWIAYEDAFDQARKRLDLTVSLVREHASKIMETQELAIGQIDALTAHHSDEEIRRDEPRLNRQLKRIVEQLEQVLDLAVLNREGRPLVAGNLFHVPDVSYADRSHFRTFADGALPSSTTYIGPILFGRVQQTTSFYVSRARSPDEDGAFSGVISIGVQPGYFQRFFQQVAGDSATVIALIRAYGSVLARHSASTVPADRQRGSDAFLAAVATSPRGATYEGVFALDGERRIVAYQKGLELSALCDGRGWPFGYSRPVARQFRHTPYLRLAGDALPAGADAGGPALYARRQPGVDQPARGGRAARSNGTAAPAVAEDGGARPAYRRRGA